VISYNEVRQSEYSVKYWQVPAAYHLPGCW